MQLLMARFADRVTARSALDRLEEAVDENLIQVADAALVYRADSGKLRIDQPRDLDSEGGSVLSRLIVQRVAAAIDGPESVIFVAAEDEAVEAITERMRERFGVQADYLVLSEEETADVRASLA
jgi:hypothetical protein